MSNCTPRGGPAQTTSTEVSSFGDPRSRRIVGPMGPYPIDIRVAPQTDADVTNDTVRLTITLSDGTEFTGQPFAKSSIPAGTTPQQFVNMIAWKELLEDFRRLRENTLTTASLGDYAKKSDIPSLTGLVTEGDLETSVQNLVKQAMSDAQISVSDDHIKQLVQSMGLAQKSDIPAAQDLSAYARKNDVPDWMAIGLCAWWPGTTPPKGWKTRDGSTFSVADNPELAAIYPNGVLPDDRGLFMRGYDPSGTIDNVAGGRKIGSYEEGSYLIKDPYHTAVLGFYNNGNDVDSDVDSTKNLNWDTTSDTAQLNGAWVGQGTGQYYASSPAIGVARPKNRAYLPIIFVGASD